MEVLGKVENGHLVRINKLIHEFAKLVESEVAKVPLKSCLALTGECINV